MRFPDNFNVPYRATDIREFWRRWHMTLSRWLRDYLYIPLGGSRNGTAVYIRATIITMGLCGLWHGAGFTFIAWGLMHGVALIVCHLWQRSGRELSAPIGWAVTMLFVIVGWVVFRADDFASAGQMLAGMFGSGGIAGTARWPLVLAVAALVSLVGPSTKDFVEEYLRPRPIYGVGFAITAVVVILLVGMGQPQNFIYFQF
jgi:alginate O-acetyltransferase complex protein AlgI